MPARIYTPTGSPCTYCGKAPAQAFTFTLAGLSNGSCDCTAFGGQIVLNYAGNCVWQSAVFQIDCGGVPTRYYFQLEPDTAQPFLFWRLSLYDFDDNRYTLYEGAPVPSWDCQSDLSLPLTTPPGLPVPPTLCSNWPAAVTLTPVTQAVGGASGSGTLQAVCTCAVCAAGTYQEWGITIDGFPAEAGIDGAYNLVYQGECTWYLLNSNGTSIQLQLTAEQAILEVTVLGTAVSSYPPALTVTGVGLCECAFGASSSSQSSSSSGGGGGGGSSASTSVTDVQTSCCPNPLPPLLHITFNGVAGPAGSCNCDGGSFSFPLSYDPSGGGWSGSFTLSCDSDPGTTTVAVSCSPADSNFSLRLVNAFFGISEQNATSYTCDPFEARFENFSFDIISQHCGANGTTNNGADGLPPAITISQ